jgi:NitT/TauT family transport system substrate-binding protein
MRGAKRLLSRALAPLVMVLALAPPLAHAQDRPVINVILPPSVDVAPLLYADHAGLFVKAGLTVQITQMASGSAIAAAIAGGSGQIGFSSLSALIAGHAHGLPFELIAPGGVYLDDDPYAFMLVRNDSTIRTGRDLDGKTIGSASIGDLDTVSAYAWIDQTGGDVKKTRVMEFPTPILAQALIDGRIDAVSVGQPWTTLALESGKVHTIGKSFSSIAPRFLMSAYFATSSFAASNPDALARFERVVSDASAYVNAHRDAIVPLLASFTKLDPTLIARTMKGTDGQYLDAKDVQPMIDASAKFGMIAKRFNAEDMLSAVRLTPPPR